MPDLPSQPAGRRAYKRYPAQVWEEHKEFIRVLFVEQGKKHDEVAALLVEQHGIDVGVRQLKRKTGEWGFVKNVPAKDMAKMVRARHRRQEQLGRPTRFRRNPGAGGFQVVPTAKLDAHQTRFGIPDDSISDSSGLPSNIIAETPSNYASVESPGVSSATQARRSDQFNALTERVFGNVHNDIDDSHGISRYLSRRGSTVSVHSRFALALEDAFNGHYHSAAEKYRLTLQTTCIRWNSMLAQFRLHVMDAACYPGCPQSLAARIADIFSQSLVQAREEYSRPDSEMGSEVELHTALLALRNEAEFWTSVLVQQRAIQLWEPILGSDHPQVAQLRHNIAYKRSEEAICVDELGRLAEGAEVGTLIAPLETDQLPSLQTVRHLLHLGDAPKDQLLEQLRLMESSSVSGQQFRENAGQTRLGRSRALFGVYYSFVGRFSDAETAFGDSERLMGHETCAETKLHRTLWYAEHKTRVQDWNGASDLICRAHQVFMASETASAFIIHHFPGRFESLCTAVSMRTPIDKISSTAGIDDTCPDSRQVASNHPHSPTLGTEVAVRSSSSPAAAVSVLSPDRLFPSTPRGAHASISIEAWRQFVEFNPTGEPTPSAEIT